MPSHEVHCINEITSLAGYALLQNMPHALLIDVRTHEEWVAEGIADLASMGKEPMLLSWQSYHPASLNPLFISTLTTHVKDTFTPLLFLCRKGVRSYHAAQAALEAGYTQCYSLQNGIGSSSAFENSISEEEKGWIDSGLPWKRLEQRMV